MNTAIARPDVGRASLSCGIENQAFLGAEHELDLLDSQIAAKRRVEVARTRELLSDLGFDVSGYDLPPYPHRLQQQKRTHPDELDLAAAIVQRRVAVAGRSRIFTQATSRRRSRMPGDSRGVVPVWASGPTLRG